ncbi:MAG TPA: putative Ig domain-containing protein, partial [Gemmataceae bacterium]|nr:putative Ig domain-containing protein [Gemmataceae bacterium]
MPFRKLRARSKRASESASVRKSTVRPFLEQLEDRLAPSTFKSLSSATVGQSYQAQLTVTAHPQDNYTFTVKGAPAWLHVSSSGKLTGVPNAAGIVEIQVKGTDNTNPSGSFSSYERIAFDIIAPNPILTLTPNALPAGTVGTPYSESFSSDALVSFGENGPLPAGLSFSPQGVLTGTPTQAGTFNIIVTAYDSMQDASGSVAMPLVINPLITVSPSNAGLAAATVNDPYGQQFSASGGSGPYTYAYATSTTKLPSALGLTLDSSGYLSGTPLETGTFPFTVMATDANGDTGTASYVLTVVAPITFTPPPLPGEDNATLPSGELNQPYSQSISVNNNSGSATLSYSVPSGLPSGLKIEESPDQKTLTIQGTPTQSGQEFELDVYGNDGNPNDSTEVDYYLTINAPAVPIKIGPSNPANGTVGSAYSVQLTGSGGSGGYSFIPITSKKGGLPPGLSLSSSGLLSGAPTTAGTYNFIVQISDSSGDSDTAVEQVTIAPRPGTLHLTDSPLPLASPGVPYYQTITAQGGTGATVLSFETSSKLVPGLNIALSPDKSTLTISGTPTEGSGAQTITVTATDSAGDTAQQTYELSTLYTPAQIAQAYGINDILLSGGIKGDGAGQTIAIIDSGDAPNLVSSTDPNFLNSDLARFDAYFGLPNPPSFLKLDEYGGTNYPSLSSDEALETTQDVEWVHALAPEANIILVEYSSGSSNGISNAYTAIQTALNYPGVTAISDSNGGVESASVTDMSGLLALNPNVTF